MSATKQTIDSRYEELSGLMTDRAPARPDQCKLIGAYFSEEFSFESAALFNPSVVPHPTRRTSRPAVCASSSPSAGSARGTSRP
jgi:hypothetical protein